jgi:lipopolysaccharide transport system ATP-binding protein
MSTTGTDGGEVLDVMDLMKIFRIYENPLDRLKEFFLRRKYHTDFVALDRMSFSLQKGETLGIIGENGAGKSTLLQLISGTLSRTSGEITVNGRILALLELGIGLHPDFSGRENIFFYSETLGFPKAYIQSKLQEIINFSELGSFIDWPLKTYSTGMQMRLAFSLVSSLDPDILIIDEALSVGDIHFQKKCIDRIMEIRQQRKTIIFCSHSTYQVNILCDKVIWLKDGKMEMYGEAEKVIPAYEFYQLEKKSVAQKSQETVQLNKEFPVIIREINILNTTAIKRGDDLKFRLLIECISDELPYNVTFSIKIESGWAVFATGTHLAGRKPLSGKKREIIITYPNIPLMGGIYFVVARIFDDKGLIIYHERSHRPFEVSKDSLELGTSHLDNIWEVK